MGAWGTAVFSDDFALDIKGDYYAMLMAGQTDGQAEGNIIEKYYNECKGTEDEPIFWFALALSQLKKGRLSEYVKNKAILFIDNGKDLERWNTPNNEKNYKKRIKELEKLKERLLSEMPERKVLRKRSVVHSPWKVGDLLAYKIYNNDIIHKEFHGKYVLLRVLKNIKHVVSKYLEDELYNETTLLGLYDWVGDEIPDKDIIKSLGYATIKDCMDPVLGKQIETAMNLCLGKKEIKIRDITIIDNDSTYENELPTFFDIRFNKYSWYHFDNLDNRISIVLNKNK